MNINKSGVKNMLSNTINTFSSASSLTTVTPSTTALLAPFTCSLLILCKICFQKIIKYRRKYIDKILDKVSISTSSFPDSSIK